jgi:hypothetical protein
MRRQKLVELWRQSGVQIFEVESQRVCAAESMSRWHVNFSLASQDQRLLVLATSWRFGNDYSHVRSSKLNFMSTAFEWFFSNPSLVLILIRSNRN